MRVQETSPMEITAKAADLRPVHFGWSVDGKVATVTLDRPDKKNPLTFESYAELRDTFRRLVYVSDVKAVVVTGAGATSAPAATCTRSSDLLFAWISRGSSHSRA